MEPTPKQQAISLITRAERILIAPGKPDGDSVGAGLALSMALGKLGKTVSICIADPVGSSYQFLPKVGEINSAPVGTKDFIITLSREGTVPGRLSYSIEDGKVSIVVGVEEGSYSSADVAFADGGYKYDLVIIVDAADLNQVGGLYDNYPTLFQEIPTLNIDHHASNSHFATVNLVDITATSACEILVGLIEAMNVVIDADMATCLLTGIISDTGSFQHANTTPKALTVAAQMVGFGARQQEIIKYLFKTKSITTLKLWGRLLSELSFDPVHRMVWVGVSHQTLTELSATKDDIGGLIDELMTSVPGADVVVLLSEREPNSISASVRTSKGVDATQIAGLFGGGGHPGAAGFKLLDMNLGAAMPLVVSKIKDYQAGRLGLLEPTATMA